MSIVSLLKKLPIDVGQAEMKYQSAGKRIAFSFVPRGEGKKVLDIGCRDDYWSSRLRAQGYTVQGLDIESPDPAVIIHNVDTGLPFGNQTFDLVWCTEVIEHLYHPDLLIKEIERILKPGGLAVLTTPNSNWWFYKVVKLWGWAPKQLQNPDHKQFWTEQSIRSTAPMYRLLGYFPYALVFFKLNKLIGFLSPTFILIRQKAVVS